MTHPTTEPPPAGPKTGRRHTAAQPVEPLLTVPELAALFKEHRSTTYRKIARRQIATVVVGSRLRVSPSAYRAYVEAKTIPAAKRRVA